MPERVMIVGCWDKKIKEELFQSRMEELASLVYTSGGEVVGTVTQSRPHPDARTYIGIGKVEEVKRAIHACDADAVVFNDELTPAQVRNLDKEIGIKVIDRTQLILDIFAQRAQTREGKIQVELAQLMYLLPRLAGQGQVLSRLGGGIGTRGPGETKLETDRRHIQRRMDDLKQQLADIESHRESYRKERRKHHVVQFALVGYTNAGKSTMLNKLSGSDTFQEDLLFATLDPLTRQITLPSGYPALVTDTVGFIQDLPTTLIAAFRSTLEEVKEADILLHVVDASHPEVRAQMETVEALLKELKVDHLPVITIYNKMDMVEDPLLLPTDKEPSLRISLLEEKDIYRLLERMEQVLKDQMTYYAVSVPIADGKAIADIQQYTMVMHEKMAKTTERYEIEGYVLKEHPVHGTISKYKMNS